MVHALSSAARERLARLVFHCSAVGFHGDASPGTRGPLDELIGHGLVQRSDARWMVEYRLPRHLKHTMARALAARHAQATPDAKKLGRPVEAHLQIAHDAAAVWACLAREPARLKADGELYQRDWPRLLATLPVLRGTEGVAKKAWIDDMRLNLAIRFLRNRSLVRARVDDTPGRTRRTELVPVSGLREVLDGDPALVRAALLPSTDDAADRLADAFVNRLAGRTVRLDKLGEAMDALLGEARMSFSAVDGKSSDIAMSCFAEHWLAGQVVFGFDDAGKGVSARVVPAAAPPVDALAGVCQSDFEVVLLRTPTPSERLSLHLLCDASPGQAHVYRLSRESVGACARAPGSPAPLDLLRAMVGDVPQNVARSIDEWSSGGRTLRLRSALFLDAGDVATADSLAAGALASVIAERLGDTLLAIPADRMGEATKLLRKAGHAVEPGLDRVSGRWTESGGGTSAAEAAWEPDSPAADDRAFMEIDLAGDDPWDLDDDDLLDEEHTEQVREVLRRASDSNTDVVIVYETDRGVIEQRVTPLAENGREFYGWCHRTRRGVSFSVPRIAGAWLVVEGEAAQDAAGRG